MQRIWFTSDHHFWHENIIKYCNRPFDSVETMNEQLIELWNSVVNENDLVYYLGDFAMALRPVEIYTCRLNGRKHLIAGNHDWCHPSHKKGKKDLQKFTGIYLRSGFDSVKLHGEIEIAGQKVLLSHFPYQQKEPGDYGTSHAQYRLEDNGLWLIHGHVHNHWKQKGRMINVSVESRDYRPISIESIAAMISEGEKDL